MKKIEAIIRPSNLEELKDELLSIDINGITITQVMGCGKQKGWKEFYRGTEITLNILPKIKLEIIVPDSKLDLVVKTIVKICRSGEVGDGKIFISEVQNAIRIRTGEDGDTAL